MPGTRQEITHTVPTKGGAFITLTCGHQWFIGGFYSHARMVGNDLECKQSTCYRPDRYMGE